MQSSKILRAKEAAELIDVGRTKFYQLIKEPNFPARIKLSPLLVGWSEVELVKWKITNS